MLAVLALLPCLESLSYCRLPICPFRAKCPYLLELKLRFGLLRGELAHIYG